MLDEPKSDGTVGKALQVLDQVAAFGKPVRFSELLSASPFPKPTLYRFVQTLTNQNMLSFDTVTQTYSVGSRLLRLAHSAWRNSTLAPVAGPYLDDLANEVKLAVHLAQLDNGHVLFVDKRVGTNEFNTLARPGKVAPSYCTGVGKAILAFCDVPTRERALTQQTFIQHTPATLTNRADLDAELVQIAKDQVAFDKEEHERGIISIAAPILVRDAHVIGAVSIVSSSSLNSLDDLSKHKPALMQTVKDIGEQAEIWQVPAWA